MNLREFTKTCAGIVWLLTILIPVLCQARTIPFFSFQQNSIPEGKLKICFSLITLSVKTFQWEK